MNVIATERKLYESLDFWTLKRQSMQEATQSYKTDGSSTALAVQDLIQSLMFTTGGVQPQEILTPALAAARRQLVDRAWSRLLALSDAVKVPLVQRRSPRQELAFLSRKAVSGCSAGTTVEVDLEAGMAAVIIEVEGSGDKQHQQQTPMTRSSAGDLVDEGELYAAVRAGLEVDAGSSRPTATDPFTEFWSSQSNGSRQNTLSIEECRIVFSELHPSFRHYGLDNSWVDGADAFLEAHLELGCNVVQSKSASSAAEYARLGIPPHLRSKLWFTLTQSEFTVNEEGYSEDLCRFLRGQVAKYELLTDRLILQEVKKCQDDDTYFVFEEMARDILLLWSRDESIASQYGEQLTGSMEDDVRPVSTGMRGRWSSEIKWFPPNGRLPMCGLSSYATLTSFLHSNLDTAYGLFRNLYLKYFQHMQTVTAHHCSITALHAMFETLLKQLDPLLFLHLAHKVAVGTSCRESLSTPSTPTSKSTWTAGAAFRPAFKWIVHGFVGTLDVEEVLLLWDRVIGFDRLELLSVMAAGLYLFRREKLMAALTKQDVEEAFHDVAMVRVVPLLQYTIFVFNTDFDSLSGRWERGGVIGGTGAGGASASNGSDAGSALVDGCFLSGADARAAMAANSTDSSVGDTGTGAGGGRGGLACDGDGGGGSGSWWWWWAAGTGEAAE